MSSNTKATPVPGKPGFGGVIHTYQKYDPLNFPSPTEPPPDVVSPAFEQMLQFGSLHHLTEEELAQGGPPGPQPDPGPGAEPGIADADAAGAEAQDPGDV